MFSREGRVRIFLAFLILVLVIVNSQSLQLSYESRAVLRDLFEISARERASAVASAIEPRPGAGPEDGDDRLGSMNRVLAREAKKRGLLSACLLDWEARLVTGGACAPSSGRAFDRLDRGGRRALLEAGWAMTPVERAYDESARAFGYRALTAAEGAAGAVLRIEVPAARLAEANRRFRASLIYQVSALSLVLLAVILFVHSLVAPHRRLVAEARSVASELSSVGGDESDEGQFLLSTFQEVVARLKQKERELASLHKLEKARADETEALSSDIIRSMTTGLVSLDASGKVALVNPAAERIFAVESAALLGRAFGDAFPGSEELSRLVEDALGRGGYHLRGNADYRRTDGATLHLGVSVIPMLLAEEGERPGGALCLLADLTEVVELRERLFLKENLARLGEMVAGIAHEFRNGLATIMGNARLLRERSDEESAEIADALIEESHSLSRVVAEFLQFARPEPLELDTVELSRLVEDVAEELQPRAASVGARIEVDAEPASVHGDEALLRKAVANLVSNAVDALSPPNRTDGRVLVEVRASEETAVIRVRDNGPGVAPEHRDKIFTPFFTNKSTGTGLGLSVVQKIVVSHDGSVELEAGDGEPGVRGACFVVRLPKGRDGVESARDWV